MAAIAVTDTTFEAQVLRSELPVLVDLYADWCAPCKQMAPFLEELAVEFEGKLRVVQVDIEKSPMVAQSFRVQSIPMLVVIAEGRVVGHHVGALDKGGLLKLVEPFVPAEASEVKPEELASLLGAGRAVPVDVRDAASFGRYRIPGAVHFVPGDVESKAAELRPIDGRIRILYARSTDEAKDLAAKLRERGVEVGFLAGGFLHWEAAGLEVERGA